MYAGAARRGLGMYGTAARSGLGDYFTQFPGAVADDADAKARGVVNFNNIDDVARALGVSPPPAYGTFFAAMDAGVGSTQAGSVLADPTSVLPGVVMQGWLGASGGGPHEPVAEAIARQLQWDGTGYVPRPDGSQYDLIRVSAPQLAAYKAAVQTLFPKIWAIAETFAPGEAWDISDPDVAQRINRSPGSPTQYVPPAAVVAPPAILSSAPPAQSVVAPQVQPPVLYQSPPTVPASTATQPVQQAQPATDLYQSPASNGTVATAVDQAAAVVPAVAPGSPLGLFVALVAIAGGLAYASHHRHRARS